MQKILFYLRKLFKNKNNSFYVKKDKELTSKLVSEGKEYLSKLQRIDQKLLTIQKSTKTTFSFFAPVHNYCRTKYSWYYNWHTKPYATKIHAGALLIILLSSALFFTYPLLGKPNFARAADYTCTWDGTTGNWSNTAKWSGCNSEYPGQTAGTSYNVSIPSGTVTLDVVNKSLNNSGSTVLGSITLGGTLNLSTNTLTMGSLTVTGTLNGDGGALILFGNWDTSGGTFTAGSSTITMQTVGGSSTSINATPSVTAPYTNYFYYLFIKRSSGTGSATVNVASNLEVSTQLAIYANANLSFATTSYNLRIWPGAQDFTDVLFIDTGATFTKGSGTLYFTTDGNYGGGCDTFIGDYNTTPNNLGNVEINGGVDFVSLYPNTPLAVDNITIVANQAFRSSGMDIFVNGNFNNLTGNIDFDAGGVVVFTGTGDQTLSTGGGTSDDTGTTLDLKDFPVVLIRKDSGKVIVSGSFDVDDRLLVEKGTLDLATNNPKVFITGNYTISSGGTVTKGSSTTTLNGATQNVSDANATPNDIGALVTSGTTSVTMGNNFKVTSLNIGSGTTFNLGTTNYNLTLTGTGTPLTATGTFSKGTGSTVTYTGTTTATNITTVAYNNLTLTPTGATTYNLTGNLTSGNALSGNLTISANATLDIRPVATDYSFTCVNVTIGGTLDTTGSASTIRVSGNWTNNNIYSYSINGATIIFTGNSSLIAGTGNYWHSNVTIESGTTTLNADVFGVDGDFNIASGATFNLNGKQVQLSKSLTLANGATWTKGTNGQIAFSTAGVATVAIADNNTTLQDLGDLYGNTADTTVRFDTNIKAESILQDDLATTSTWNISNRTVTITGTNSIGSPIYLADATFTTTGSTLILASTGAYDMSEFSSSMNQTVNNLEIQNGTWTAMSYYDGNNIVNGNFTLTSGGYAGSGTNLNVGGNFSIANGATFTNSGASLTLGGTTQNISDANATPNNLGVVGISGSSAVTMTGNIKITQLIINIGTSFNLGTSNYTLTITGTGTGGSKPLIKNGTFNKGTGSTVVYTGSGANTDITSLAYNNLTLTPSSATTYSLQAT